MSRSFLWRISAAIGVSILALTASYAEQGVIVVRNNTCFAVYTNRGYSLISGWANVPNNVVIIGSFSKFGITEIFDSAGNSIPSYAYVSAFWLTQDSLRTQWGMSCPS